MTKYMIMNCTIQVRQIERYIQSAFYSLPKTLIVPKGLSPISFLSWFSSSIEGRAKPKSQPLPE